MIRGIGVDAVEISRMEKAMVIPGFKESTFTKKEIENEHGNFAEYYAVRFACKEAVFKALHKEMDWRKIETLSKPDGSPYVIMENEGVIHISVTTEGGIAIAYCAIEE